MQPPMIAVIPVKQRDAQHVMFVCCQKRYVRPEHAVRHLVIYHELALDEAATFCRQARMFHIPSLSTLPDDPEPMRTTTHTPDAPPRVKPPIPVMRLVQRTGAPSPRQKALTARQKHKKQRARREPYVRTVCTCSPTVSECPACVAWRLHTTGGRSTARQSVKPPSTMTPEELLIRYEATQDMLEDALEAGDSLLAARYRKRCQAYRRRLVALGMLQG